MLILFNGSGSLAFPVEDSALDRVSPSVLVFLTSYSLFQFLVALLTLSQFGRVYVTFLEKDGANTSN
jgi:hypothetical protein